MSKKVWFITGTGSGIGLALCEYLLAQGESVVALTRNKTALENKLGTNENLLITEVDLTDRDSIANAVKCAIERFGRIDVVVNNAGYELSGYVEEIAIEEFKEIFDVNFFAPFHIMQLVLPYMRTAGKGCIINMSSISGTCFSFAGSSAYNTSKVALDSLSKTVSDEVKKKGISVVSLILGKFNTDIFDNLKWARESMEIYAEEREKKKSIIESMNHTQKGDVHRLCRLVSELAAMENPPKELFVGKEAYDLAKKRAKSIISKLDTWEARCRDMDYEEDKVMNKAVINSDRDLINFVQAQSGVYFYGGGKIAQKLLGILDDSLWSQIQGIIVTTVGNNKNELYGIPVIEVTSNALDKEKNVLIAVGKKFREQICEELNKNGFNNIAIISDEFELQINTPVKQEENPLKKLQELEACIKRVTPKTKLKALVVNICDHCNLNCRGCDHFSPIAEKRFIDKEQINKDLRQIRTILNQDRDIEIISVLGGEPLLHPDLISILKQTREIFPATDIWLSTNGILLLNQTEEFWMCCRENKITINVTKYPVNFAYEKAEALAKEKGVTYSYYHGGKIEKTLGHYPLDVTGSQDAVESFMHCFHANGECNMLNEGRLYTCTMAPCLPIFCKKYGAEIPLTEEDGIDIYSITSKRELFELLSRPMPVCSYCKVKSRTFGHPWEQSERRIEEWT